MVKDLMIALFAMTAGFTASGIVANSYRLAFAKTPEGTVGQTAHLMVMVVAGPNVLFENAANSMRAKSCSAVAFWLASAVAGYWSFVLGLFLLNIVIVLTR
jgi:hypothetical protein